MSATATTPSLVSPSLVSPAHSSYNSSEGPNGSTIVGYANILLLMLIILLIFVRIPRFFARLYHHSEWESGHILRYVPFSARIIGEPTIVDSLSWGSIDLSSDSEDSSEAGKLFVQRITISDSLQILPHAPSDASGLGSIFDFVHQRFVPGVSYLQLAMMSVWLAILCFPAFYQTNAFTDPVRFGWIAISQLPFVYTLGSKNNILGFLLGVGYEKLNLMHRFVGRIVFAAVNVHALGFFYKWLIAEEFQVMIGKPQNYIGLMGLICVDCLFFFSTDLWRREAYSYLHRNPCIFMSFHYDGCNSWAYGCAVIYVLDLCLRVAKTRFCTATIHPLRELGVTRVELPKVNSGWRVGQHVRLRVISSGMGLFGWSGIHPFTIASVADSPEGLVLFCKKAGNWTNKLFNMANSDLGLDNGEKKIFVMVEGPYGGLGNCMLASFSAAVFVVGGSGISFATSTVQDLIRKSLKKQTRVKSIELIWTVQDPSSLVPMLPLLTTMIQDSVLALISIRISVFYTRAPTGKFPFTEDFFSSACLTLSPGRPTLQPLLQGTIDRTVQEALSNKISGDIETPSGLFVGVCGPTGLAESVRAAVGRVDPQQKNEIGGVEVHEETFGW
ncbi:hypothetical protein J3R30DRAFT_3654244 [Lentinula aciculospora]|uniref:ferric-chelate reductase (NADPH) n=1 Tax=Lentinula aciculospora TaxID=153920 RepID=A0A9W9ASX8_9AGAR|nr:hypothetical protein J3R30DRAFT_3654244 [Lentinula aciculospora]